MPVESEPQSCKSNNTKDMLYKIKILDDIGIDMDGVKIITGNEANKQSLDQFTMSSRTNRGPRGSNVDG